MLDSVTSAHMPRNRLSQLLISFDLSMSLLTYSKGDTEVGAAISSAAYHIGL